jgi:deoxyribonuclease V
MEGPSIFDLKKARLAQQLLSKKVSEEYAGKTVKTVCGMDVSYHGKGGAGAAVVLSYPDLKIIETKVVYRPVQVPYIPTFLAFREMSFFTSLIHRLEETPDIFIIDGHGIYHPAFCGSASHFGVVFDAPTIGVAGGLMGLEGEVYDRGTILLHGRKVGQAIKDGKKGVYVSIGHRVDLDLATSIVRGCIKVHRKPEPLFLADSISREALKVDSYRQ